MNSSCQDYSFTEHINARFQLHAFVYAKIQVFRYCYFGLIAIVRCLCRYSLPCSTQLDTLSLKVSLLYPKKTLFSLMIMITIFNEGIYSSMNRWTSGPLENCTQNKNWGMRCEKALVSITEKCWHLMDLQIQWEHNTGRDLSCFRWSSSSLLSDYFKFNKYRKIK